MKITLIVILLSYTIPTLSREIKIISQNLGTSLLRTNKKNLSKMIDVIDYYQADFHLFQNTFNKSTNIVKTNPFHPYFNYHSKQKKRVGNILTTKFPIKFENYTPFNKNCSLWRTYGISSFNIKLSDNDNIHFFNVTMPKSKKHIWDNIEKIEEVIKTTALDNKLILLIEFNQRIDKDVLSYLQNRLGTKDSLKEYLKLNGLSDRKFRTGFHKKNAERTNVLLTRGKNNEIRMVEAYPVFDGTHDENRYLKDAGTLFHLDI